MRLNLSRDLYPHLRPSFNRGRCPVGSRATTARPLLVRVSKRPSCPISALRGMLAQPSASPDLGRLTLTEAALASADRLWREQLRRAYGPDEVLTYGYAPEAQGGLGTPLRRSYEARRVAVAVWRRERQPVVR